MLRKIVIFILLLCCIANEVFSKRVGQTIVDQPGFNSVNVIKNGRSHRVPAGRNGATNIYLRHDGK